tara:strand:- start:173 stop:1267 length:1095 start_codon:yes stop_codon:yes gene_type:complete
MSKAADLANLIGNINAGGGGVNRNALINGSFNVAQRGTSVTDIGVDDYGLDRWKQYASLGGMTGRSTHSQETITDLEGFTKALKIAVTTTETPASNESYALVQRIEAQDSIRFGVGTSNAKPLALSFYAKANASITLPAGLRMQGGGIYLNNFNITTSWQRFSLSIPAVTDTNMATTSTGTDMGAEVFITLMANADIQTASTETWTDTANLGASGMGNLYASTSNFLFVTGVQLEVGQNPTEFEHEPIERTLYKCQRYYFRKNADADKYTTMCGGYIYSSTNGHFRMDLPTTMRALPTIATSGTFRLVAPNADNLTSFTLNHGSPDSVSFDCGVSGGHGESNGNGGLITASNDADAYIEVKAEL